MVRPATSLIPRSAIGLTGAGGTIYTHFAPTPFGAVAVITSEMLLYRLPDPEIEFPAGTDLLVRVQVPDDFAPSPEPLVSLSPELSEWVAAQPEDVYLPDKKLAGDIIHLVFAGFARPGGTRVSRRRLDDRPAADTPLVRPNVFGIPVDEGGS